MNLQDLSFNKSWTLFLDRDGVINRRIIGDYVKFWEEFIFEDEALEGIRILSGIFGRLIVVSNQQGVGKGLMVEDQVNEIHVRMITAIENAGGRIDRVYFSPHLEERQHPDRKPGIGMALKARKEFPDINFEKSLMVGDSLSDMQFGRNNGMINVLISPAKNNPNIAVTLFDFNYSSLYDFAIELQEILRINNS